MEITIQNLIVWSYGLVGAVEIAAYAPQIFKLMTAQEKGDEISLSMWYMWLLASIVGTAYAALHLKDPLMTILIAAHIIGCLAIVLLTLYNRHIRFKNKLYHRRSGDHPIHNGRVELPHESKDVAELPSYMQKVDDYHIPTNTPH